MKDEGGGEEREKPEREGGGGRLRTYHVDRAQRYPEPSTGTYPRKFPRFLIVENIIFISHVYNNKESREPTKIRIPPPPRTPAHIIFALFLSVLSMPCPDVLICASPISLCTVTIPSPHLSMSRAGRNHIFRSRCRQVPPTYLPR